MSELHPAVQVLLGIAHGLAKQPPLGTRAPPRLTPRPARAAIFVRRLGDRVIDHRRELVTTAKLATLTGDEGLLDRATLAKLRSAMPPLIYTEVRKPIGTLFVLVAADEAGVQKLIDRLAAMPALQPGIAR
jgi:hypothetical protein